MISYLYIILLLFISNISLADKIIQPDKYELYTWRFDGTEGFKIFVTINQNTFNGEIPWTFNLSCSSNLEKYGCIRVECSNTEINISQHSGKNIVTITFPPLKERPKLIELEFWFHFNGKEDDYDNLYMWLDDDSWLEVTKTILLENNYNSLENEKYQFVVDQLFNYSLNYKNIYDESKKDFTIKSLQVYIPKDFDEKLLNDLPKLKFPLILNKLDKTREEIKKEEQENIDKALSEHLDTEKNKKWEQDYNENLEKIKELKENEWVEYCREHSQYLILRFYSDTPEEIINNLTKYAKEIKPDYTFDNGTTTQFIKVRPGVMLSPIGIKMLTEEIELLNLKLKQLHKTSTHFFLIEGNINKEKIQELEQKYKITIIIND